MLRVYLKTIAVISRDANQNDNIFDDRKGSYVYDDSTLSASGTGQVVTIPKDSGVFAFVKLPAPVGLSTPKMIIIETDTPILIAFNQGSAPANGTTTGMVPLSPIPAVSNPTPSTALPPQNGRLIIACDGSNWTNGDIYICNKSITQPATITQCVVG